MSEPQLRVLLVDDEVSLRDPLTRYLENEHGFQVDSAATGDEAWQMVIAAQGQYDVALIDDMLGSGQRGLDVTRQIKATYPDVEVIVFTAWGGDWVLEYLQAGAYRHLSKPFDPRELGFLIQTAAGHSRIRKEKDLLRSLYEAGNAVISIMEPQAVLEVIVRQACQALKGWWAKVVLIADDGTPTEQVSVGFNHRLDLHDLIRSDGISRQVMTSGKPYQIPDVRQELNKVNPRLLRDGVGAAICIPLRLRGKNIGVIWIHYKELRRFLPPEIDALQIYAAQAAIAYDNARLLDELGKARHAARIVAQVTVLEDLKRTLELIVDTTQEILRCDAITLFSYDQERDEIEYRASRGVRYPERMPPLGKSDRRSALWKVLTMKESYYVVEDAQHNPVTAGRFVREEDIVSSISFPLKFGDRKVGALFVNYCSPHRFTESEITTIGLLADQAAVAIRNTQLFTALERRANALTALYEAGQKIIATLDMEQILNQIVLQSWRLARQDGEDPTLCNIMLKEGQKLQFADTYPKNSLDRLKQRVGSEIDLERGYKGQIGISGRVALSGQSVLTGDVRQHPDYIKFDLATRSELAVPIKFGDRIIGVINVEHPDVDAFDEQDRRALELLAVQAATAIENARKYEELRHTKGLVGSRTALAWMGMISNTWRHAIEGHAVSIVDYVQLLRRDVAAGTDAQAIERRLNAIERLARKIQEKPITPPISNEEGVESVCINNLVRERVRQRWQYSPYNAVHCQWNLALDDEVTVRASPEWLRRALDILLDNAVETMTESPVKELAIATQQTNGRMQMMLSDTGPGIPPQVQDQLFQKPIDKPKGDKGLGMGLLMAQMIAQTYGGDIYIGHTGADGTAMVLELPVEG
jgi:GAF domain-containing protein/ActR/RegA family two-component response regulator